MRWPILLLGLSILAACRPPARLAGDFPSTNVLDAQRGGHDGEQVRWGGVIVATTPERDHTCLEILGLPLDRRARPRFVDEPLGRFIACAPGLYDPKIYTANREVTVVGTLTGSSRGKVGNYDYLYPRVDAQTIFLWGDRADPGYAYYPYPYAYDPYSYPYPYLYPYVYPYWYPYPYAYPYWYPYWGGGYFWGRGGWHGHDHGGHRPPGGGGRPPPGGGGRPPGGGGGHGGGGGGRR